MRPSRLVGGKEFVFDVVEVLQDLDRRGVRSEFWGRDASRRYRFANAGDVWSACGSLWECCPAWYSRYADGREALIAQHAVELAIWSQNGSHGLIHTGQELTPRVASLVNMLRVANSRLSAEAQERAIKRSRGK